MEAARRLAGVGDWREEVEAKTEGSEKGPTEGAPSQSKEIHKGTTL